MTTPAMSNILLVEDTLTQALMLKHLLEGKKYSVAITKSGAAAIEYLQSTRPDAILSDVNMPEIDGYMLCNMLKKDQKTRDIPFILLVSLLQTTDILEIIKCGADGFVFKCYDESFFVPALTDVLETIQITGIDTATEPKKEERFYDGQKREIGYQPEKVLGLLLSTFSAAVHQNTVKVKHEN